MGMILMVSFVICLHAADAYQRKPCLLDGSGGPRNPGIALLVTNNGLDYLMRVMSPILNREIARFRMPYVASGSSFGKSYEVQDLQVDRYTPPRQVSLSLVTNSPTHLRLHGSGLSAEISAFLSSSSLLFPSQNIYFDLDDVVFTVGFAIRLGPANKAAISITECNFDYGALDVSTDGSSESGLIGSIVNNVIERKVRSFFDDKVCDTLQSRGSEKLTEWLGRLPTEIRLYQKRSQMTTQRSRYRGKRASRRFTTLKVDDLKGQLLAMASKLSLDLHIVRDAKVSRAGTSSYLEIPLNGQVRIIGGPKVPFYPKPMPPPRRLHSHHLYVLISEFTINSMLYQLYVNDLLNIIIEGSRSGSEVKEFLQTSCDGGRCIGTLLPAVFRGQKRQYLQMRIFPYTCPVVKIQGPKGIQVDLALTAQFYSQPPKRKMLYTHNLRGTGRMEIRSKMDRITGKFTSLNMEVQTKFKDRSEVFDLISDITSSAIESKVNQVLETGFRIPSLSIAQIKNLYMETEEGGILIGVNLVLNTAMIQNSVSNLLHKQMASSNADY
ncbi:LBP [Trichuris trichiura]|uniref:LBP n=1 Tax=Trichuris trichiura TaxID=36087 RepID=A0A077Z0L0_TRITR|nr:LBP [Trichuris trichiura]